MKESAMGKSPRVTLQKQAAIAAVARLVLSWLTRATGAAADQIVRPLVSRMRQIETGGPSVGQTMKESAICDSAPHRLSKTSRNSCWRTGPSRHG